MGSEEQNRRISTGRGSNYKDVTKITGFSHSIGPNQPPMYIKRGLGKLRSPNISPERLELLLNPADNKSDPANAKR